MSRQEHHVVQNPNGGWDVKRNGSDQAVIHTNLKRAARLSVPGKIDTKSTGIMISLDSLLI